MAQISVFNQSEKRILHQLGILAWIWIAFRTNRALGGALNDPL
jgi:hypothetical protein